MRGYSQEFHLHVVLVLRRLPHGLEVRGSQSLLIGFLRGLILSEHDLLSLLLHRLVLEDRTLGLVRPMESRSHFCGFLDVLRLQPESNRSVALLRNHAA